MTYEASISKNADIYEGFTIQFEDNIGESSLGGFNMNLLWDDTKVSIPIQVIGEIEKPSKKKKKRK